ncbi:MAG: class B sortase [Candidatus Merdivicinus sp.]|jgi:sortase B
MTNLRKIILALALLGFVACVLMLGFYYWNSGKAQRAFERLENNRPVYHLPAVSAQESTTEEENPLDNPDCVGWISIADTKISYPVMQRAGENTYYLRRNFAGKYSESGTPFLDIKCDLAVPESPLYIFGHNMKSGTMFADLLQYRDPEFEQNHAIIELETAEGIEYYQIFSVLETSTGTDELGIYDFAGNPERDLEEFCQNLRQKSLYEMKSTANGRLLILITCTNSYDEAGRFYVAARQIEKEDLNNF